MKLRKLLAVVLSFVLVLSSTFVASAANGPNSYLGYIEIYGGSTDVFLYNNYTSDPVGKISGATYDTATNTLTLKNFNQPSLGITTNTMGDDFKINLTGENHIQYLSVWGDMHGGSCEFTGSGKLFINENKLARKAIYIAPEGTNSIFKASGSTTITAYSSSENYSLFVDSTENKNCIVGNASVKPTVSGLSYDKTVSVITYIDPDTSEWEVYSKEGSSNKFAVKIDEWTNATYYYIYQIVKNPEDNSDLLCHYLTGRGDFSLSSFGLALTGETVEAHMSYYNTAMVLWKDENNINYVFDYEWDLDSGSSYYQKCTVSKFVTAEGQYENTVQWYISTPTDDTTRYSDNRTDPLNYGYTTEREQIEGIYCLYVSASPFTLTAGNHTHSYKNVVTKATLTKNGKIVPTCSCGATKTAKVIYSPKTFTLSAKSYTYDGKAKKPTVTVKDSKGNKIAASNYTVTYSNNKNVGSATVKLTFKGNYSGTKTVSFAINPKGTTISSLTAGKKKLTVKVKKQTTQTTGYQIQYATNSKFTSAKSVSIGNKTTSKAVSGLKAKQKYFVRVRTYKTVNGTKYYSAWSSSKTVTTK